MTTATKPKTARVVEALTTQHAGIQARIGEINDELERLTRQEDEIRREALAKPSTESSWSLTQPVIERRGVLLAELESLDADRVVVGERLGEAADAERTRRRVEVIEASGAIRDRQLVSLAKAGRLLAELRVVFESEIVENAAALTALRSTSERLFDAPGESRPVFREPFSPFPNQFSSFLDRLRMIACSPMLRTGKLGVEDGVLDAIPDLTADPLAKPIVFDGVEQLPIDHL